MAEDAYEAALRSYVDGYQASEVAAMVEHRSRADAIAVMTEVSEVCRRVAAA